MQCTECSVLNPPPEPWAWNRTYQETSGLTRDKVTSSNDFLLTIQDLVVWDLGEGQAICLSIRSVLKRWKKRRLVVWGRTCHVRSSPFFSTRMGQAEGREGRIYRGQAEWGLRSLMSWHSYQLLKIQEVGPLRRADVQITVAGGRALTELHSCHQSLQLLCACHWMVRRVRPCGRHGRRPVKWVSCWLALLSTQRPHEQVHALGDFPSQRYVSYQTPGEVYLRMVSWVLGVPHRWALREMASCRIQ